MLAFPSAQGEANHKNSQKPPIPGGDPLRHVKSIIEKFSGDFLEKTTSKKGGIRGSSEATG